MESTIPDKFIDNLTINVNGLTICIILKDYKIIDIILNKIHSFINDEILNKLYIYDKKYIHITLATLINFKNNSDLINIDHYKSIFNKIDNNNLNIKLEIENIEFSVNACIIKFKPNNLIDKIRENIVKNYDNVEIPNIVHSTIIRYKTKIPLFKLKHYEQIINNNLFKKGNNIICVKKIFLVHEYHPYMHINFNKGIII
jgi:hypothetical protein